jgi:hypothetical protein
MTSKPWRPGNGWVSQTFAKSSISAIATVLVYLNAALASNVHDPGILILFILLIASVGLLAIANEYTDALLTHGCKVEVEGEMTAYARRLNLVEALLKEKDRNDAAMRIAFSQMGMTVPANSKATGTSVSQHQVTM